MAAFEEVNGVTSCGILIENKCKIMSVDPKLMN